MSKNRFITGIFNYCDYWCERCAFTRRCRNFAMGREMERRANGKPPVKDATNAEFWNRLAHELRESTVFGKAEDWASNPAPDFEDMPDPEWEAREDARRKAVKEHPLIRDAHTYMKRVDAWLKGADADLKTVARELIESAESRFADGNYEEEAREIGEMLEVVAWYHTLIPPKLGRAVGGLLDRKDPDGDCSDMLSEISLQDANGSGKVALVAIERSMAAWIRLREVLPHREDDILGMLALLSRLRRGVHAALPGARTFFRPGFDGEPPPETEETD